MNYKKMYKRFEDEILKPIGNKVGLNDEGMIDTMFATFLEDEEKKEALESDPLSTEDIRENEIAFDNAGESFKDARNYAAALLGNEPEDVENFPNEFNIDGVDFKTTHYDHPYGLAGETANDIYANLANIFNTPRGKEILEAYKGRSKYLNDDNITVEINNNGDIEAELNGNLVRVDPVFKPNVLTDRGIVDTTMRRLLSHELPHAMIGTGDRAILSPGPNVLENENPIMKYLGGRPRIRY